MRPTVASWSAAARCWLHRHNPGIRAAGTAGWTLVVSVAGLSVWTVALMVAAAAAVEVSRTPCRGVCPDCVAHRDAYESRVGEHLPDLALWHRIGLTGGRRLVAFAALVAAVFGATLFTLGIGPADSAARVWAVDVDTARSVLMSAGVFVALWWYLGRGRVHDMLTDVCPYCRH